MKIARFLSVSAAVALGLLTSAGTAGAASQWIRNLTILGVSETDNYVQVGIVTNGTIQLLSIPMSSSMATRFQVTATAAWLAGKPLDVKVDLAAAQGCNNLPNCENVLGWYVHN